VQNETQWRALQQLLPALAEFGALEERIRNVDAIENILAQWTMALTPTAAMQRLQRAGIAAAELAAASRLTRDPQLVDRQFWALHERAHVGAMPQPAAPYRSGGAPLPIARVAPTLGEHNQLILGGWLGLDAAEIAALAADGVIGNRPMLA
jgi:crotonobetainyl-CoA:carnitine CoA-transferase CaiB-like acyl-CoA transferase